MIHKIQIQAVLNGFIVQVGCQTVVFQSVDQLCAELKAYLRDPAGIHARYRAESLNSHMLLEPQTGAPAQCDREPSPVPTSAPPPPPTTIAEACNENMPGQSNIRPDRR
jgi:hypothetical protein